MARKAEAKLMRDNYETLKEAEEADGNLIDYHSSESSDDDEGDEEGKEEGEGEGKKLSKRDRKVELALDLMYERMLIEREKDLRRTVRQRRQSEKKEGQSQNLEDFSNYGEGSDSENEAYSTDEENPNSLIMKDKVAYPPVSSPISFYP